MRGGGWEGRQGYEGRGADVLLRFPHTATTTKLV